VTNAKSWLGRLKRQNVSGTKQTASGTKQAASGMKQAASGKRQNVSGTKQTASGTRQTASGKRQNVSCGNTTRKAVSNERQASTQEKEKEGKKEDDEEVKEEAAGNTAHEIRSTKTMDERRAHITHKRDPRLTAIKKVCGRWEWWSVYLYSDDTIRISHLHADKTPAGQEAFKTKIGNILVKAGIIPKDIKLKCKPNAMFHENNGLLGRRRFSRMTPRQQKWYRQRERTAIISFKGEGKQK